MFERQDQADLAFPGIVGGLLQGQTGSTGFQVSATLDVMVHGYAFPVGGVNKAAQLGDQAADVGGAAGAVEPVLAVVGSAESFLAQARDLQRVFVEKVGPVQRKAAQGSVVESALGGVGIFPIQIEEQHALHP